MVSDQKGMDQEDEHNFSDDGFDNLPDDALAALEENAILSTQQPRKDAYHPAPEYPITHGPSAVQPRFRNEPTTKPSLLQLHAQASEYDSFETVGDDRVPTPVDEIPSFIPRQANAPSEMTEREQWRQNRFGNPQQIQRPQYRNNQPQPSAAQLNAGVRKQPVQGPGATEPQHVQPVPDTDRDALSARIDDLLEERDKLFTELTESKEQLMTQKGEIFTVRENKEKEVKIYDRQLNALKKSMQEESAKHAAAMEALTARNNALRSEFNVARNDLSEEARRTKSLEARLKGISKPSDRPTGPATTPQKQRAANPLRDGFDDDEVMVLSPAKSANRCSKQNTPTAAGKRKRKVDASPIQPLVLRQSNPENQKDENNPKPDQPRAERVVPVIRRDRTSERHLKLVQKTLNFQLRGSRERLMEVLVNHSFPSTPTQTFSALILESIARLSGPRLPGDLLQIFIDLWSRSLKEKYYNCISILIEVVDYMTDIDMSIIDKISISNLLPVLQDSASINGLVRFQHSPVARQNFGLFQQTPQTALNSHVDSTSCLSLLYKVACLAGDAEDLIKHYWGTMTTDSVLMGLNPWQPIPDITLMLHLLATSIFSSTFGNICSDASQQSSMETHIINRISMLLWETPKVDEGQPNPSRSDVCHFRLEALNLLSTLAMGSSPTSAGDPHHHGSILLASHPSAIARLVRAIYDATASLYQLTPASSLHAQMVNRGVRLLYSLMTLHGDEIDLQQKLQAVNGGVHKHRVVLTRLAFSEGWYIDSEVTDETVALATAMLEDSVTPDEAEMMIQAFPGFTGRKRTTLAKESSRTDESMEMMEMES